MVARIAPEPISTSVAVSEFRSRAADADVAAQQQPLNESPLPPVLTPVPTPVPAPAIVPVAEAFAASQFVEQMPQPPVNPTEVMLRLTGGWQAPESELHLADRQV